MIHTTTRLARLHIIPNSFTSRAPCCKLPPSSPSKQGAHIHIGMYSKSNNALWVHTCLFCVQQTTHTTATAAQHIYAAELLVVTPTKLNNTCAHRESHYRCRQMQLTDRGPLPLGPTNLTPWWDARTKCPPKRHLHADIFSGCEKESKHVEEGCDRRHQAAGRTLLAG